MEQRTSSTDILRWGVTAWGMGAAVAILAGIISFLIGGAALSGLEADCTGEWCGLATLFYASLIGMAGAAVGFVVTSFERIRRVVPTGSKARVAAVTYLAIPATMAVLLGVIGALAG